MNDVKVKALKSFLWGGEIKSPLMSAFLVSKSDFQGLENNGLVAKDEENSVEAPNAPAPSETTETTETILDNLEKLKVPDLMKLAETRGIVIPPNSKKADIIALLKV
jgi:hypothetical protein